MENNCFGISFVLLVIIIQGITANTCGDLSFEQARVSEGGTAKLIFKPYTSKITAIREWYQKTSPETLLYPSSASAGPKRYTEKSIENWFTLSFELVTAADNGNYILSCGSEYSNYAMLTVTPAEVLTPPSDIQFSNVENISDCSGCIAAQLNAQVVVECFVDGGSEPIELNMFKDGQPQANVDRRRDVKRTYLKHDYRTSSGSFGIIFTCTVKNPALEVVKEKTVRLYIKADPSTVEIKVKQYKENELGEIKCLTTKGRPTVKSMIFVNAFQQNNSTVSSIESDNTFNVTTTYVRNFTRIDSGLEVYCCSTIINTKCSNTTHLDVLFPPKNAIVKEIKKNNLENGDTELTLQCKVNESNPRSVIKWEGIKQNPRSLLDSGYTKHSPTQGWIYTEERVFNLTKEDNYRSIRCVVSNEMFPGLDLVATFKPNITYAPTVTISGVDSRVVYLGDEVFLTCNVDSNPQSRVSWYSHTDEIKELYGVKTLVLHLTNVSLDHSQTYSCSAHNGIGGIRSSNITLIVKDDSEKPETETLTESGGSSVAVPVIGGVVVIVVAAVAIAVFVIVRKKRQNAPLERRGTHQVKIEDRKRSEQPTGDEPVYNNTAASGHEQEMEDSPEYACVAPKKERERNKASSVSNNDTDKVDPLNEKGDKLIYAELDLTDQGADNAVKRPLVIGDEQTEYVSIDFSKTGTATQEDVKEP